MPGMVTPATIGWNIVRSSWRPRKYHGALEGFGVRLKLASASSGALTNAENTSRNAVRTSAATNSASSRCGHVWTLSTGLALTSWMEPALTTVSRRCVWPSGPVSGGAATAGHPGGGAGAAAAGPLGGGATLTGGGGGGGLSPPAAPPRGGGVAPAPLPPPPP